MQLLPLFYHYGDHYGFVRNKDQAMSLVIVGLVNEYPVLELSPNYERGLFVPQGICGIGSSCLYRLAADGQQGDDKSC